MTSYSEESSETIVPLLDTKDEYEGTKIFRNVGNNLPVDR
jgi:hypothetical protein